MDEPQTSSQSHSSGGHTLSAKLLVLLAGIAAVGIGYWQFRDLLTLDRLAEHESWLRSLKAQRPVLVGLAAVLIYTAVAGASLPVATIMTLACGWYFGFWIGLLVVSFGSTAGATVAFLLSRYLVRDWVRRRFGDQLARFQDLLAQDGAFYLFSLRLIPAPFFVINAVMGLTKMRAITFWWVSQLGMLPTTAAYVYAGSAVPSLRTLADEGVRRVLSPQLLIAFVILGILPLLLKKSLPVLKRLIRRKTT